MDKNGQNGESKIFGYLIDRTAKKIKSDINRRFRNLNINLTAEQWMVLSLLDHENGQSQTQLADQTSKDAPTTSRIINLLCEKDFALRSPTSEDRRVYRIFITDNGRREVTKAVPEILKSRNEGWDGLTDQDYEDLLRIMETIHSNLSQR